MEGFITVKDLESPAKDDIVVLHSSSYSEMGEMFTEMVISAKSLQRIMEAR